MKPIATFISHSNRIEGVYDSKSHQYALEAWDYLIEFDTLTVKNILETHRLLMRSHITTGRGLGEYRTIEVATHSYNQDPKKKLIASMVPTIMDEWIDQANETLSLVFRSDTPFAEPQLSESIKTQHIRFEEIHPFIDGNGRMGRILMNWQRDKLGLPILVLTEKDKDEYFKWFDN
jgi:Fic family protein